VDFSLIQKNLVVYLLCKFFFNTIKIILYFLKFYYTQREKNPKTWTFLSYNQFFIKEEFTLKTNLWIFCTSKWLVKIDNTNTRVERCKTNIQWLEIQNAYNQFVSKGLIEKNKQLELDASVLIPNIVGNITSYSARLGVENEEEALKKLYNEMQKYLSTKGTSFVEAVNKKKLFFKNCEVNNNE